MFFSVEFQTYQIMSISVKNISKYYGEQKALDNVSFNIKSGEIVGFLGPNGAGKSTMMKIITGFIPPNEGEVKVNDMDILEHSMEIRKQIGYLPEHNPLYEEMYVREFLQYSGKLYKLGKELNKRVEEVIEHTGLLPESKKKIGALSKGYRQRVGLANALLSDPKILILDEPTTGLDPNQIVEIRNLISQTGKEKTIMLSTHIMQEVEAICDRIIIIKDGKIVADDATKEIHRQSQNRFQTIQVEFNSSCSKEELETINGVEKVAALEDNNWLLQASDDTDIRPKIFQFAVEKEIMVLSMQQKEKSLEEVFQELTK